MKKIKAISFDFWETIVSGKVNAEGRVEQRISKLTEILKRYGNYSSEEIKNAYEESSKNFTKVWINDYKTLEASESIKLILEVLGLQIQKEDFEFLVDAFEESLLDFPPQIFPELFELLPKLKQKFSLAIICDTGFSSGKIIRQFLEKEKFLSNFSAFSFSNEVRSSKPHPKNYEIICEAFGIETNELLHIGDNQRSDIAGIQNVGGLGFLFAQTNKKWLQETTAQEILTSWNDLEKALKKHKI